MKLQLMGGACQRVQEALEQGMGEGTLSLPPELVAHAARCPRCGPEVRATEELLARLRRGAVGIDLSPVPRVVDHVMEQTAGGYRSAPGYQPPTAPDPGRGQLPADLRPPERKASDWKWVVGQIAAVAAAFVIAIGGLTYMVLKVNEAVSGTSPGEVIARLAAPFHEFTTARFRGGR